MIPAGQNASGQLNLFLFEVVGITRDPDTGKETVFQVGVHPLVVVPNSIRYSWSSRTTVVQTIGGSQVTRAPRGFRQLQLAGDWGVQSVGILPYIGTGEVRAKRFADEVVAMSDAIEKKDVDGLVNILTGTPGLKLLLARYYARPDDTSFAINFYDLWNDRKFQCVIRNYTDTRLSRRGGATGNIGYTMAIDEAGPIVTGAPGTAILNALFNGLGTWSDINAVLETYTVGAIVNSTFAIGGIAVAQLLRTRDAVVEQIESVTGLLGGFQSSTNDNLNQFLANASELNESAERIIAAGEAARTPQTDGPKGGVAWGSDNPDLPSGFGADASSAARAAGTSTDAFANEFLLAMDESDVLDDLEDLADAAKWQLVAGKLFGYSTEEYRRLLSSGGRDTTRRISGTIPYTVEDSDTPESIEERFGCDFDELLAWNNLTPDEALISGLRLEIPVTTASVGGKRFAGLPVFGSQFGQDAWGVDLDLELRVDTDGGLLTIAGEDALVQGANWLIEEAQTELLAFANAIPEKGRVPALKAKVSALLLVDKRITAVEDVTVTIDLEGGVRINSTTTAINGGIVDLGSAA